MFCFCKFCIVLNMYNILLFICGLILFVGGAGPDATNPLLAELGHANADHNSMTSLFLQ